MAGESILKIKKWEQEASEIGNDAKNKAKRIIQKAHDARKELFKGMDENLRKEEIDIKKRYAEETEKDIQHLKEDEHKHIEAIHARCKKSLGKVVDYIAREIVKV